MLRHRTVSAVGLISSAPMSSLAPIIIIRMHLPTRTSPLNVSCSSIDIDDDDDDDDDIDDDDDDDDDIDDDERCVKRTALITVA